jgi:hypothetical protein
VFSFLQVPPPELCMHLSSHHYVLHALPISVFLTVSPKEYLVRCIEHKALCYVAFFTTVTSSLLDSNILLSTPFSKTLILHSSLNVIDNVSSLHTTKKKQPFHIYILLREECRLRVFENRVLRRIFGPKKDEVTGEWRRLHNEELYVLYFSSYIIRVIKSRRQEM